MRNFASIAAPLSSLLSKSQQTASGLLVWGEEQQLAFDKLRDSLTRAPCLSLPNFALPFVVETDASDVAVGATLC